jgi:hypothetical protein
MSTDEDALDLKTLDQLHNTVLEFNKTSQELKKMCVGLITAVPALIFAITDSKLDASVFVAGLLIAASFWIADAYTYYYQDKIRVRMASIVASIRERNDLTNSDAGTGISIAGRTERDRLRRSFFNPSQLVYGLLATIAGVLWLAFALGAIGK